MRRALFLRKSREEQRGKFQFVLLPNFLRLCSQKNNSRSPASTNSACKQANHDLGILWCLFVWALSRRVFIDPPLRPALFPVRIVEAGSTEVLLLRLCRAKLIERFTLRSSWELQTLAFCCSWQQTGLKGE